MSSYRRSYARIEQTDRVETSSWSSSYISRLFAGLSFLFVTLWVLKAPLKVILTVFIASLMIVTPYLAYFGDYFRELATDNDKSMAEVLFDYTQNQGCIYRYFVAYPVVYFHYILYLFVPQDKMRWFRCLIGIYVSHIARLSISSVTIVFVFQQRSVFTETDPVLFLLMLTYPAYLAVFIIPAMIYFALERQFSIMFSRLEMDYLPKYKGNARFNKVGLTFNEINKFVGGQRNFPNLSTKQVCDNNLGLLMSSGGGSYAEKNASSQLAANVFVSHARKSSFSELLGAIQYHFRGFAENDRADLRIWLDMLSINQDIRSGQDSDWWCGALQDAIAHAGIEHVLLMFSPWDNPATLTRAWCLWEIFITQLNGRPPQIIMGSEEENRFIYDVLTEPTLLLEVLSSIAVERSEGREEDVRNIHNTIKLTVGIRRVNEAILSCVRGQLLQILMKFVSSNSSGVIDKLRGHRSLCIILLQLGNLKEALKFSLDYLNSVSSSVTRSTIPDELVMMHYIQAEYLRIYVSSCYRPISVSLLSDLKKLELIITEKFYGDCVLLFEVKALLFRKQLETKNYGDAKRLLEDCEKVALTLNLTLPAFSVMTKRLARALIDFYLAAAVYYAIFEIERTQVALNLAGTIAENVLKDTDHLNLEMKFVSAVLARSVDELLDLIALAIKTLGFSHFLTIRFILHSHDVLECSECYDNIWKCHEACKTLFKDDVNHPYLKKIEQIKYAYLCDSVMYLVYILIGFLASSLTLKVVAVEAHAHHGGWALFLLGAFGGYGLTAFLLSLDPIIFKVGSNHWKLLIRSDVKNCRSVIVSSLLCINGINVCGAMLLVVDALEAKTASQKFTPVAIGLLLGLLLSAAFCVVIGMVVRRRKHRAENPAAFDYLCLTSIVERRNET
jgi:hypothetical protein